MRRAFLTAVTLAAALGLIDELTALNALHAVTTLESMQASACGEGVVRPALNAQPFQWKAGLSVGVWVDRDGSAARGRHRNPKPMFTYSQRDTRALFDGVNQWGDIPETGVTFRLLNDNADFRANYWITVAWPAADITFRGSDGQLVSSTCQVPPASRRSAAYTCSFQDRVLGVSQSHTIGGAITLINTAHSYINPHDGRSYDTWAYRVLDWPLALVKIASHENGHLMGLADMPSRDADGLERPHVMKPFNGTNDAAPFGGAPRLAAVTACDREAILSHPSRQYERWVCAGPGAVAPMPCRTGEVPVCRGPYASYPSPVWACDASGDTR